MRLPYEECIRTRVWGPLGMESTALEPTPDMQGRMAVPYFPGRLAPAPRLKANVWPAGIVHGTIHDQARRVRFNLGDGAVTTPDSTVRSAPAPGGPLRPRARPSRPEGRHLPMASHPHRSRTCSV